LDGEEWNVLADTAVTGVVEEYEGEDIGVWI